MTNPTLLTARVSEKGATRWSRGHPWIYRDAIERCLASPRYGERWGKFWLDVAGYADSNGYFNADTDRPLAHRYRDYTIRAINHDKPWDRFIQEQIAGDERVGHARNQDQERRVEDRDGHVRAGFPVGEPWKHPNARHLDSLTWKQYTDPNADDKAFITGRVALSWVGHWVYNDYAKALGSDLVLIPLPNFGAGAKTGQGSLAWGISAGTKNPQAAAAFLDFALSDESVKTLTDANAAPPGTKTVTAASTLYAPGGPLQLYADGLAKSCGSNTPTPDCVAVPRTVSPGWPTIQTNFGNAVNDIWNGADPKASLDKAAKAIDTDFADNDGYAVK